LLPLFPFLLLLSKVPIALTEIKEWWAIFALYEKNFRIVYGLKQRQTLPRKKTGIRRRRSKA
jgi:hypothetical protein